jgi:uncharacterized membrane protein YphA (DoxX/SURF4 family)/peroxiredoxin
MVGVVLRVALAAVFTTAGFAKLIDLTGSRRGVADFGIPRLLTGALGTLLPVVELGVAAALLLDEASLWGAVGALALLLAFAAAMSVNLARGRTPECRCFGQVHSAPASWPAVGRNLGLAALALAVVVGGRGPELGWGVSVWLGIGIAALSQALVARARRRAARPEPLEGSDGLRPGTPAPPFSLPALNGSTVSLDSLREAGRPVLLVFSDHACGPCQALAPKLAGWQRHHADEVTIAVIERNRDGGERDEHGRDRVLLADGDRVAAAFRAVGTPAAVLVDAEGRIASGVASGIPAIEARLAAVAPDSQPAAAREGLTDLCGRFVRRDLLVRAAAAWAATSAVLSLPLRSLAWAGPGRQLRRSERCEDVFDCPDPHHMTCRSGRCACGQGLSRCNPEEATTQRCFALDTSEDHCGRCNHACSGDDRCCSGNCVDVDSDPDNCGGCFDPALCPECRCRDDKVCRRGKCVACPAGRRRCGNRCGDPLTQRCCGGKLYDKDALGPGEWRCCNHRLVNTQESENHCGECDHRCGQNQFCYQGRCRTSCPAGMARCGNTCREQGDSHCGSGCTDCTAVSQRFRCCEGKCVDVSISNSNCGCCGNVCGEGCFCNGGGRCVPSGIGSGVTCSNC